ncbi:MAG: hypothetical protein LBU28_11110 [Spirochaetaceae bacterium]|nr:hypothetical protein [Spirochaetaceae bacterium]
MDIQEHKSAGLGFEELWMLFQETRTMMKELSQEATERSKETDRKIQELAESSRETDRKIQEVAEQSKETDRQLRKSKKELDRRMGELGNRFGELAEHLVGPNIQAKFGALGCHIDAVSRDFTIRDDEDQALAEIDLLLQSSDAVIAVEIKAKLLEKDVDAHIKRLEVLRRWADNTHDMFVNTRKIRGAVAAPIVSDEVGRYALDAGFYLILQTGDTVKIAVPQGFVPREW